MPKKSAKETAQDRKSYNLRKAKLFELEKDNYGHLYLMRARKPEFWQICGHSAVIFMNVIAPMIGVRSILRKDTDYDHTFKEGVVTLGNLEFHEKKLKSCEELELEKETENFISFRLKHKVSEEEYELILHDKEVKKKSLENEIAKTHALPSLQLKMEQILAICYRFYRKYTDAIDRELLVGMVFDQVRLAHKILFMVCRAEEDKKVGLLKIKGILERVPCDMVQILQLEVWPAEKCILFNSHITEAINAIDAELKRAKLIDAKGH